MFRRLATLAALSLPLIHCAAPTEEDAVSGEDAVTQAEGCADCVRRSGPELFTYDELVALSRLEGHREGERYVLKDAPKGLEAKLNALLTTPFVSNEAYFSGARKHLPRDDEHRLGHTIRTVAWNIERGEQLPLIIDALKAADDPARRPSFYATFKPEVRADAARMKVIEEQLDALAKTDVFILNELDLGMRRSGYARVAEELGKELRMNWAYGVEFVEIDPISIGTERFEPSDFASYDAVAKANVAGDPESVLEGLAAEANAAIEIPAARKADLRALHGNAVLSRYPIKNVRLEPLQTKQGRKNGAGCWDWNGDERAERSFADGLLEQGQRIVADKMFLTKTSRELRHGGRTALIADLVVNGLDGKPLTVVDAHIEAKATPRCRQDQMTELLAKIDGVKNPVIMAGDLNTSGTDGRPMTLNRLLFERFEKPEFYLKEITKRLAVPYAGWGWLAWDGFKFFKKLDDPTSLFNPEHRLFDLVKARGFDFRGEKERTIKTAKHPEGTRKTLANSNERDTKGFKTTFATERTLGPLGKMKLDWMLVRTGFGKNSYRMAPHFARTMEELTQASEPRLSDHFPIAVVLPLSDPCLGEGTTCTVAPVEEDDYTISAE